MDAGCYGTVKVADATACSAAFESLMFSCCADIFQHLVLDTLLAVAGAAAAPTAVADSRRMTEEQIAVLPVMCE